MVTKAGRGHLPTCPLSFRDVAWVRLQLREGEQLWAIAGVVILNVLSAPPPGGGGDVFHAIGSVVNLTPKVQSH